MPISQTALVDHTAASFKYASIGALTSYAAIFTVEQFSAAAHTYIGARASIGCALLISRIQDVIDAVAGKKRP